MKHKQANWLDDLKQRFDALAPYKGYAQGAALGGAAGATLAGLASLQNNQDGDSPAMRRRRILRNTLTGGVLGAGAGVALPALAETFSGMAPPKTDNQLAADRLKAVVADDKPLGGWLGHILGGGGTYAVANRLNRSRVLDEIVNKAVNPTMRAAYKAYSNTGKSVDDALAVLRGGTSTAGNANALDDAIEALIKKDPTLRGIQKLDNAGQFTKEWNNAWAQKKTEHANSLRAAYAQTHYDPLVREGLSSNFGRAGGRGTGVLYGGYGPKSWASSLWDGTVGRLLTPKADPDQLGVLLQKNKITIPQAITHLDTVMRDVGKTQEFASKLPRAYSGRAVNPRLTRGGYLAVGLGATAPTWIPPLYQWGSGLVSAGNATVQD
jgi:hypothetical protein